MTSKLAGEVEIGDMIVSDDDPQKIEGWFFNGSGKMVLLHGGVWHTYSRLQRLEVLDGRTAP